MNREIRLSRIAKGIACSSLLIVGILIGVCLGLSSTKLLVLCAFGENHVACSLSFYRTEDSPVITPNVTQPANPKRETSI